MAGIALVLGIYSWSSDTFLHGFHPLCVPGAGWNRGSDPLEKGVIILGWQVMPFKNNTEIAAMVNSQNKL